MNELQCPKCNNMFEAERIPKLLPCGHTLCVLCAQEIIRIKYCNVSSNNLACKKSLKISNTSELPTNTVVLNLCSSLSNLDNFHKLANDLLEKTKRKNLLEIESSLDNVLDKMNYLEKYDATTHRWDMVKIFEKFNTIKEKMDTRFQENNYINILKYKYTQTNDALLLYLMDKLRKRDKIFAAEFVQDQKKFGEVFLKGNGIHVNSLSLTEVEKNSTVFWLHEFKKHFHKNICSFLVFPCTASSIDQSYTMIFDITEGNIHSGFVEICTGEMGSSFKGSSFPCVSQDFIVLNEQCCNDMRVNCVVNNLTIFDEKSVIISYISRGKWEIEMVKMRNSSRKNVVGRFIDDVQFSTFFKQNSDKNFVKESGIAVFQNPQNTFRTVLNYLVL